VLKVDADRRDKLTTVEKRAGCDLDAPGSVAEPENG
jgi:hypothetical protein